MSDEAHDRRELLERIQARRASIGAYVSDLGVRGARLTNLSIVCSAVVTALTAGPALGGTRFADGAATLFNLPSDSLVWRGLCFLAMILSIVAAVTTNLYKTQDVATRLSAAETCNAGLEGLETLVQFGQVSVADAVKQYQQYVAEIPFVHDRPSRPKRRRSTP
jgi:hypothetical protein